MASLPPAKKLKVSREGQSEPFPCIFDGTSVYIFEEGLGKVRCNILKQQVINHGGHVEKEFSKSTTHVLVNKKLRKERVMKIIGTEYVESDMKVLFADWLSACLIKGELVKDEAYFAYPDLSIDSKFSSKKSVESNRSICLIGDHKVEPHGDGEETGQLYKTPGNIGHESYLVTAGKEITSSHSCCHDGGEPSKVNISNESPERSHCNENFDICCLRTEQPGSNCIDDATKLSGNTSNCESGSSSGEVKFPLPGGRKAIEVNKFVCAKPSSSANENFNACITDKLEVLQKSYTNTQDRWRSFGYKKAINSIKNHHKPLETYEEVSQLPFVGEKIAKKVWEIIETGHLRKLDHLDPKVEILDKFTGVWGAGPTTAERWFAKGFRTLEDLQEKAELTFQQKIGLKHYKDINERMPRSEVAEIEAHIRKHAEILLPDMKLVVCGSYRRGCSFCGDIDILISHPNGQSHQSFLGSLLNKLKEVKLITDDLITVENETQRKYMGLCKLPKDDSKYRRIDFIAAPYEEWPLALLHFTGSAHFNRSMRLLAKKKNMSLSEHALRRNVVRDADGEKIQKGKTVPVSSEEDIFRYLGLDFLEAHERNW